MDIAWIHPRSGQGPPKIHKPTEQDPSKIQARSRQDPSKIKARSWQHPAKIQTNINFDMQRTTRHAWLTATPSNLQGTCFVFILCDVLTVRSHYRPKHKLHWRAAGCNPINVWLLLPGCTAGGIIASHSVIHTRSTPAQIKIHAIFTQDRPTSECAADCNLAMP